MRRTRDISVKGCPVQLSRLFTAPGHLAKGATNGWCTLFAKPSVLELALSAEGLSFSYSHKNTLLGCWRPYFLPFPKQGSPSGHPHVKEQRPRPRLSTG